MKNIHGGDIYQYNNILDFSANINPLGAPESVNRSSADAIGQIGHYPEMYSDSQMMIFVNEVYKAGRCPREFAEA